MIPPSDVLATLAILAIVGLFLVSVAMGVAETVFLVIDGFRPPPGPPGVMP